MTMGLRPWASHLLFLLLFPSLGSSSCVNERFAPQKVVHCALSSSFVTAPLLSNCSSVPEGVVALVLHLRPPIDSLSFSPDAFKDFTTLHCLDVSRLGLTSLPSNLFRDLRHLESLNLSSNHLTALPNASFSRLDHLERLDLSSNSLTTLPSQPPPTWPLSELHLSGNDLPPCWSFNDTRLLGPPTAAWWCWRYERVLSGLYRSPLLITATDDGNSSSTAATDAAMIGSVVVWYSPTAFIYAFVNTTRWRHHFSFSWADVSGSGDGDELRLSGMRPYFAGVWSCLRVWPQPPRRLMVISQVLVQCKSPLRSIYHWSLIASAGCTVVMLLAGIVISLVRTIYDTRCFTQKIHVINTMSLEELQYSPRTQRKRLAILRRYEANRAALLAKEGVAVDEGAAVADSLLTSTCGSIEERCEESPFPPSSPVPEWLPPHRRTYNDIFAHGGFSSGGEEEEVEGDDDGEEGAKWRERLRLGMVRHVAEVRTRMREQRLNMEESTSRMMRQLRSGGQNAALKVRSGFASSMDLVKWKVRGITELCGGAAGPGLGQTVSVSTLVTDLDTQTTTERRVVDFTSV